MTVFTRLTFRILPPLYELNRATIAVPSERGEAIIRFAVTRSGTPPTADIPGNATVPGDDLGALHNTIVQVEVPAVLGTYPQDGFAIAEAQVVAAELLNCVVEHYRNVTGAAQVRRIPARHARAFLWLQDTGDGHERSGRFVGGSGLRPDGPPTEGLASGDPAIVAAVQAGVRSGPLPLWTSLYLDALAEFYTGNTRSGLVHLYMSFEMLANETCQRLGEAVVGAEAASAFLAPPDADPPVVHLVLKYTREWAETGPSKSAISRLVRSLWKYRNDLLHGRLVVLPPGTAESALAAFGELATWLQSARPAAPSPRTR